MKILLIDVNYKQSSTGKMVYDLYHHILEMGHEAAVCYGRGPLIEETNVIKFSSNIEMVLHALLTRITGLTGIFSPLATYKLIQFIEKFKPDVIHIHELHAYFVNIGPLLTYLKKKNIKVIWTFHCEFMYTGKCGHAYDCENWKTECRKCPQVHEYPKSIFFDFTRKMFRDKKRFFEKLDNLTIVTPSNWLANRVSESFLKDKALKVIYNGIDTKSYFHIRNFEHLKSKWQLQDERVVISVAPNLMSKSKGGMHVVELAKRFKGENIRFILIGIDDLSQKFDDNIIGIGRTYDQSELAEYYSMADVTILASEKETFSLVVAESLACGTPVLGFESGAPSEIAPEGYGLFLPHGDIDQLESSLRQFLNGERIMKSNEECSEFGKEMYSKERMLQEYFELYIN